MGRPRAAKQASATVSERGGWAWIEGCTSASDASRVRAIVASALISLAPGLNGEAAHLDLASLLLGLLLGEPDAGHLGRAVRAVRDLGGIDLPPVLSSHRLNP